MEKLEEKNIEVEVKNPAEALRLVVLVRDNKLVSLLNRALTGEDTRSKRGLILEALELLATFKAVIDKPITESIDITSQITPSIEDNGVVKIEN